MSNDSTSAQPADPTAESESASKTEATTAGRPLWLQVVLGLVMAVVGLLVVALLISFLLPSTFVVSRSVVIDATTAEIHPYVNTLNKWPQWTAWNTDTYPELKYAFEGPESGVGAIQSWTDPGMGGGRLEITESSENTGIAFTLYFEQSPEPLIGTIAYASTDAGGTRVIWTGRGDVGSNPVGRYFALMMDSMIGADYEAGLAKLKTLAESQPDLSLPPQDEPPPGGEPLPSGEPSVDPPPPAE